MTSRLPEPSDLLKLQLEVLELAITQDTLHTPLRRLCNLVEELLPGSLACVQRLGVAGILELECAPSAPPELLEAWRGERVSPARGSAAAAVHEGAPALVADAGEDPRWADARELAGRFGIRAAWSIPLRGRAREVTGAFTITRAEPGLPGVSEEQLLRTAAHLAEVAFDRDDAKRSVRDQRQLLASIIDGSEDPIFVKDADRRYLLVNAAEVRGVRERPEDMIGLRDEELYGPDTAEKTRLIDEMVLRTGRGALYEQEFENSEEGRRSFLVRMNPLVDDQGRVQGVIGIARDVTPLKRAELRVRQIQKLESLGLLAGGIAHDFNNILTGILGNAELASAMLPPDSPALRCLGEIERSSLRAAELTSQLLAYAGRAEAARRPVSLPELVGEVEDLLSSTISKQARRSTSFPDDLPPIEADPTQIRQVLMNLLTNAAEALSDGPGHIEVAARAVDVSPEDPRAESEGIDRLTPGRFVELRVADDGIGMDEASLARVFEPFFSTKFAGRGLGLAAVQGIVRGHGGTITAESRLGRGSTFTVMLPVSRDAPVAAAPAEPRAPAPRGSGTVLVVEDEPPVQEVVRRMLEAAGFSALTAGDGEEACEVLARHGAEIVAVVLDLTTPRLSGPEAFRRLRALRPDLPVVVASGYTEEEALAGFAPGEVARFVRKPFRGAQLLGALHAALQARGGTGSPTSR